MWDKIKNAFTRSLTVANMAIAFAGTFIMNFSPYALDALAMPEAAQIVQSYKPGWSSTFVAVIAIISRLRSLKVS